MKKLRLLPLVLWFCVSWASTQVIMTPQTVAYGIKPLANETFEVHCTITGAGATTGKVNWTITGAAGGSNATLVNTTNSDCTNHVTVNNVQGTLTLNGSLASVYANVTSPTAQAVTSVTIANAGQWLGSISTTFPIIFGDNNGNEAMGIATTNGSGAITGVAFQASTSGWAGTTVPNQTFFNSTTGGSVVIGGTVTAGVVTAVNLVSQSGIWDTGHQTAFLRDTNGNVAMVKFTISGTTIGSIALASSTTGWNTFACFGSGVGCALFTSFETTEPYTVTSPQHFTIDAQSVDDTSVHATWRIDVAANTTACIVNPFYKTLYSGQTWELQAHCTGTMAPAVDWSITSSPGGGTGALRVNTSTPTVTTNMLNATFSATGTSGRYTIHACNHAEPTKCGDAIAFVTSNALPSYAATPQGAQPVDCTVDPAMTGTLYDVGPGKAYADFAALPSSIGGGSTIRFINQDLTGSSPTTLHNYFYIVDTTATNPAQPIRLVGCPDSLGNPPVLDASGATGASWVSNFDATDAFGALVIAPISGGGNGTYSSNPKGSGPYNVVVEGLAIKNARTPNRFSSPGTTDNCCSWGISSVGIRLQTGYNFALSSNSVENNSIGIGSFDNSNDHGWGAVTQNLEVQGNDIGSSGDSGVAGTHNLYVQSKNLHASSNNIKSLISGAQGADLKTRSFGPEFVTSNFMACGASRTEDKVDREDVGNYISFGGALGIGNGFYGQLLNTYLGGNGMHYGIGSSNIITEGDAISMDTIAGFIASSRISISTGNNECGSDNHYAGDHGGGDSDRFGEDIITYQTTNGILELLQLSGAGGGAEYSPEIASANFQNSIFWQAPATCTGSNSYMYGDLQSAWYTLGTNVSPGTGSANSSFCFNFTPPILGGDPHFPNQGFGNSSPTNNFPNSNIMTARVGVTLANMLTAATQPFDAAYVPTSGSVARGAAVSLTGLAAMEPPNYEINPTTGVRTLRNLIDIGGRPFSTATLVSIAVTPNPATVVTGSTAQLTATGTWSDATTTNVTNSATWTNGSSPYFDVSKQFYQNIQNQGSSYFTVQSGTTCCGGLNVGNTTGTAFSQASPSLSGNSIKAVTTGDSYNMQVFTNGLDCTVLPGGDCSGITDIVAEVHVYIPSGNTVPDALEGPNVTNYTGTTHQYPSVQCNGTTWDLWNGATGHWVSSGFSCTNFLTVTNTWHDVKAHYTINQGANTMTYVDLIFDGTPVFTGGTTTYSGESVVSAAGLKAQVQIDGANGSSLFSTTAYYDNWTITVSPGTAGKVTGISPGSGTVTATYLTVPGTATVNVAAPGPTGPVINGGSYGGTIRFTGP